MSDISSNIYNIMIQIISTDDIQYFGNMLDLLELSSSHTNISISDVLDEIMRYNSIECMKIILNRIEQNKVLIKRLYRRAQLNQYVEMSQVLKEHMENYDKMDVCMC